MNRVTLIADPKRRDKLSEQSAVCQERAKISRHELRIVRWEPEEISRSNTGGHRQEQSLRQRIVPVNIDIALRLLLPALRQEPANSRGVNSRVFG
jgi:hypothetical protein